jgi:hypothetical protein
VVDKESENKRITETEEAPKIMKKPLHRYWTKWMTIFVRGSGTKRAEEAARSSREAATAATKASIEAGKRAEEARKAGEKAAGDATRAAAEAAAKAEKLRKQRLRQQRKRQLNLRI